MLTSNSIFYHFDYQVLDDNLERKRYHLEIFALAWKQTFLEVICSFAFFNQER